MNSLSTDSALQKVLRSANESKQSESLCELNRSLIRFLERVAMDVDLIGNFCPA